MQRLPQAEYLGLGRQLARLLGSCLEGASGDLLRELARAYDPSANEARISAEGFIFHKYLLLQSSSGSVRTCERSKTLPTFGPAPMAHPKQ